MLVSGTVPTSNKDDEQRKVYVLPHKGCTLHPLNYSWKYDRHNVKKVSPA